MKNIFLSICSILVLNSCLSANSFTYKHKQYGLASKDNTYFMKDREECDSEVYAKGVSFEGNIITDKETIERINKEYINVMIANFKESLKQNSGAAAYAGASAAAAVTTGNQALVNQTNNISGKKIQITPEKYKDFERLGKDISACLAKKGWKP